MQQHDHKSHLSGVLIISGLSNAANLLSPSVTKCWSTLVKSFTLLGGYTHKARSSRHNSSPIDHRDSLLVMEKEKKITQKKKLTVIKLADSVRLFMLHLTVRKGPGKPLP